MTWCRTEYGVSEQTAGKWAFDGKLDDLSDVLAPIKDRFDPVALSTAFCGFNPLPRR